MPCPFPLPSFSKVKFLLFKWNIVVMVPSTLWWCEAMLLPRLSAVRRRAPCTGTLPLANSPHPHCLLNNAYVEIPKIVLYSALRYWVSLLLDTVWLKKEISNISVGVTYFHFLVNFSIQPDERILVKYHMHGGSIFLILKPSLHQFSF